MSGIDGRSFGQIADVAADFHRIGEDVEAGDLGGAGGGGHEAGEDAHGGGLAGAVGAEETENFAFIYGERNVIDGGDRAVGLRQILNFYQCIPPLAINPARSPDESEQMFILKNEAN